MYFVAESFKDATEKVRAYARTLKRPFGVRYNPYTETLEVMDTKEKLVKFATSIQNDMQQFVDVLSRHD